MSGCCAKLKVCVAAHPQEVEEIFEQGAAFITAELAKCGIHVDDALVAHLKTFAVQKGLLHPDVIEKSL
jgi:hypothetical protein